MASEKNPRSVDRIVSEDAKNIMAYYKANSREIYRYLQFIIKLSHELAQASADHNLGKHIQVEHHHQSEIWTNLHSVAMEQAWMEEGGSFEAARGECSPHLFGEKACRVWNRHLPTLKAYEKKFGYAQPEFPPSKRFALFSNFTLKHKLKGLNGDIKVLLRFITTKDTPKRKPRHKHVYAGVSGRAETRFHSAVVIIIPVSRDVDRRNYQDINTQLIEVLKHEYEHMYQPLGTSPNIVPSKDEGSWAAYLLQPHEVEAWVAGLYATAKLKKMPIQKVILEMLPQTKISDKDRKLVKAAWEKELARRYPHALQKSRDMVQAKLDKTQEKRIARARANPPKKAKRKMTRKKNPLKEGDKIRGWTIWDWGPEENTAILGRSHGPHELELIVDGDDREVALQLIDPKTEELISDGSITDDLSPLGRARSMDDATRLEEYVHEAIAWFEHHAKEGTLDSPPLQLLKTRVRGSKRILNPKKAKKAKKKMARKKNPKESKIGGWRITKMSSSEAALSTNKNGIKADLEIYINKTNWAKTGEIEVSFHLLTSQPIEASVDHPSFRIKTQKDNFNDQNWDDAIRAGVDWAETSIRRLQHAISTGELKANPPKKAKRKMARKKNPDDIVSPTAGQESMALTDLHDAPVDDILPYPQAVEVYKLLENRGFAKIQKIGKPFDDDGMMMVNIKVRITPAGKRHIETSGALFEAKRKKKSFFDQLRSEGLINPPKKAKEAGDKISITRDEMLLTEAYRLMRKEEKRTGKPSSIDKFWDIAVAKHKPTAREFIAECQRSWGVYCKKPSKTNLLIVVQNCEAMKVSKAKSVKAERTRCMKSVRAEAKSRGWKI